MKDMRHILILVNNVVYEWMRVVRFNKPHVLNIVSIFFNTSISFNSCLARHIFVQGIQIEAYMNSRLGAIIYQKPQ